MILDVSQLMQNDGASKALSLSLGLGDLSFNGQNIVFTSPVLLEGTIKNIGGRLYMELAAEVSFDTQCARCLDTINERLLFSVSEVFSKTASENSDEDVIVSETGNIDLDDVVEKAFVGVLPINYLCSENCRGLCGVCGCNLNRETCSCSDDGTDSRLAVLKDFFDDKF